ncbi:hypothetical protein AXF42_Ash009743 [Apostasia shenzhenica]|uniref:Uncharacterized protein n=1 Tax=Apostasia shenzhenica TaxID=1088818 RepID=A0A2I0AWZ2_9ASPA|nr:hypothetical protein AXF42_Ash009743 [Apostasia shenzhenica]
MKQSRALALPFPLPCFKTELRSSQKRGAKREQSSGPSLPSPCSATELRSNKSRGKSLESDFLDGNGDAHFVLESELFLREPEEALELGSTKKRDGDDETPPLLTDIHGEVPLRHVRRRTEAGALPT